MPPRDQPRTVSTGEPQPLDTPAGRRHPRGRHENLEVTVLVVPRTDDIEARWSRVLTLLLEAGRDE
jgi:hypothetical protein